MEKEQKTRKHVGGRWPVWVWVASVLWMAVIFAFSAQDGTGSSQLSAATTFRAAFWFWPGFSALSATQQAAWIASVQFLVRKAAHFSVYAVLGGLYYLDARTLPNIRWPKCCAWAAGTIYAASDELHQLWVPGRSGRLADVALDSAGVLAGVLAGWALWLLWKKVAAYAAAKRQAKQGL